MASPEQKSGPLHFSDEKGHKFLGRLNPGDYSFEELQNFLDGAIQSNLNGNLLRFHLVFPSETYVLTEDDFEKTREMTAQELEEFKEKFGECMAYSKMIFILRQKPRKPTFS